MHIVATGQQSRMLAALAFLPSSDVIEEFATLTFSNDFPLGVYTMTDYFEDTWGKGQKRAESSTALSNLDIEQPSACSRSLKNNQPLEITA